MKTLFMETTKIGSDHTVSEIQRLLGAAGCTGVMTTYEKKEVTGISFQILFLNKSIAFNLPCRWKPIYDQLYRRIKRAREGKLEELESQAKRVAWRQILRWVEAQIALVETDMVKIQEVFLPYVQMDLKGTTFYQSLEDKGFKMLAAPEASK